MTVTQASSAQTRSDVGLATALRISVSRLARRLRVERTAQGTPESELSDPQFAALSALERHSGMTPGELAEHEKGQPPSMTRVIAALEERGLGMRAPHSTDRRPVVLSVTAGGGAGQAAEGAAPAGAGAAARGGADWGAAQPGLTPSRRGAPKRGRARMF